MTTKVYVGIGHGLEPNGVYDPGAVAPDGTQEHALNAIVCGVIALALAALGADFYVEPFSGASHDPDYRGAVTAVNAGGYGLAIEIHFDDAAAPRGGFGIYSTSGGQGLADAIARRWAAAGLPARPSYHDVRGLWFLRGTSCPSLIWECDRTAAHDGTQLALMGNAIAAGICDELGLSPQPPAPPAPDTEEDPVPASCKDPLSDGQWYVFPDGAVWAEDGAPYLGGLNTHPDWHAGGPGDRAISILPWRGTGSDAGGNGYVVTVWNEQAKDLQRYRFPRSGALK